MKMRRDERRSPTGPPFISFRLSSEGGLGAPGTEVEGLAGLGAPGTEVQGFAGYHAPSLCRLPAGNSVVLIELSVFQTHNPICLEN